MTNTTKNILWGILIAAVLVVGWGVSTKNKLVNLKETTTESWAQVENQLQRRMDLIPNLVNSVKGYAKHEKAVFENIANARAKMAGAQTLNDRVQAANQMQSALARLLVVVENYPNLKANESFRQLMDELAGTENRISVERKRFNENVKVYNITIRKFPTALIANWFGYTQLDYFKADDRAKEVPTVQFE